MNGTSVKQNNVTGTYYNGDDTCSNIYSSRNGSVSNEKSSHIESIQNNDSSFDMSINQAIPITLCPSNTVTHHQHSSHYQSTPMTAHARKTCRRFKKSRYTIRRRKFQNAHTSQTSVVDTQNNNTSPSISNSALETSSIAATSDNSNAIPLLLTHHPLKISSVAVSRHSTNTSISLTTPASLVRSTSADTCNDGNLLPPAFSSESSNISSVAEKYNSNNSPPSFFTPSSQIFSIAETTNKSNILPSDGARSSIDTSTVTITSDTVPSTAHDSSPQKLSMIANTPSVKTSHSVVDSSSSPNLPAPNNTSVISNSHSSTRSTSSDTLSTGNTSHPSLQLGTLSTNVDPDITSKYIINLSSYDLSSAENGLLNKGLGYCPTPRSIDSLQLNQDLQAFNRRMRLKEFFFDKESSKDPPEYYPFTPPSSWNPPKRNPILELFLEKVNTDIKNIKFNRHVDNLTHDERLALRSLRSNPHITIKPADKGSAIVVQNRSDYVDEGLRQLNNSAAYKTVSSDPTSRHTKSVQKALTDLKIDPQITAIYPDQKSVKCPLFYMLPKVHKPENPGRPIVSGMSCPTSQISRFIDFHLRPLVNKLPSFIQDTTHFIRHLNTLNSHAPFPPQTLLVSADVSALYTNITHHDGLKACKEFLNSRSVKHPPTDHLTRLLELVLTLNTFEFNQKFYKQIQGIRMGTCAAPAVANLFMGCLEKDLLSKATKTPLQGSWKRYIDDIHFLWTHGEEDLQEFKSYMNNFHPTIRFTFEISSSQVPFLDTLTQLKDNRIETTLYSKPTDKHTYLLPSSCHPPHTFKGVPYSQALRVRRICSQPEEEEKHLNNLKEHLLQRQYPEQLLDTQIGKAKQLDKNTLLTYKQKTKNTRVPLVVTYNPAFNQIKSIISKHIHIITSDPQLSQIFDSPPMAAFRRPRNIRDILVNARVNNIETSSITGCTKCTSKKCAVCPFLEESTKFSSVVTGESFPITSHIHCKSSWIIYLISCKRCGLQYVGKTSTTLYTRFTNTKSDIKGKKKKLPIVDHFNLQNHSIDDISLKGIESIHKKTEHIIRKRESYWIAKLRTLKPEGINSDP